MCERRDELKAQIQANKAEIERHVSTIEGLRLELEQSRIANEKGKELQAEHCGPKTLESNVALQFLTSSFQI